MAAHVGLSGLALAAGAVGATSITHGNEGPQPAQPAPTKAAAPPFQEPTSQEEGFEQAPRHDSFHPFVAPSATALVTPSAGPSPTAIDRVGPLEVAVFAQGDRRWGSERYSLGSGDVSVGEVGCTMTVVAEAALWASGDKRIDPGWVNKGHFGEALHLATYRHLGDELGHDLMWLDGSTKTGVNAYIPKASPLHAKLLDSVRSSLEKLHPVALGLVVHATGMEPDTSGVVHKVEWSIHSVMAVGIDAKGDIEIDDPATGTVHPLSNYTTLSAYEGIYRADEIDRPEHRL